MSPCACAGAGVLLGAVLPLCAGTGPGVLGRPAAAAGGARQRPQDSQGPGVTRR